MANANDNPPPTAEPPTDQLAERRRQRNAPQSRRPSRRAQRSDSDGPTDAARFDGATGLLGAGLGLDDVEDADDVLDSLPDRYTRENTARPDDHEPQSTATATETRDQSAVLVADDVIRARLHHHHEQHLTRTNRPSAPRGSAELPAENHDQRPTARIQAKTPRRRQTPTGAQRLRSRRNRSLVAAAAIVLAGIATLLTLDNLGTHSQPTQTAATRSTAGSEATPALLYVHRVNDAATRNPNLLAGVRHRATARHAKRARHGRARHHVNKPAHTHRHAAPAQAAPSTPAPQTAIPTHSTPTEPTPPATTTTPAYTTPATTPASSATPAATTAGSTDSSSGTSSSHNSGGGGGGGGSSTTAGPTAIGSATGCDPQCR